MNLFQSEVKEMMTCEKHLRISTVRVGVGYGLAYVLCHAKNLDFSRVQCDNQNSIFVDGKEWIGIVVSILMGRRCKEATKKFDE